jgi:hypothetical protein
MIVAIYGNLLYYEANLNVFFILLKAMMRT